MTSKFIGREEEEGGDIKDIEDGEDIKDGEDIEDGGFEESCGKTLMLLSEGAVVKIELLERKNASESRYEDRDGGGLEGGRGAEVFIPESVILRGGGANSIEFRDDIVLLEDPTPERTSGIVGTERGGGGNWRLGGGIFVFGFEGFKSS